MRCRLCSCFESWYSNEYTIGVSQNHAIIAISTRCFMSRALTLSAENSTLSADAMTRSAARAGKSSHANDQSGFTPTMRRNAAIGISCITK